jgi:hypothetical protein
MNIYSEGTLEKTIKEKAYQIFEARGKQHGHDIDDWLFAEQKILKWYIDRVGLIIDRNDLHGSGVFVKLTDGKLALFTAAHVIFPSVLSGLVRIYSNQIEGYVEPKIIRIHSRADVAVLVLPDDIQVQHIDIANLISDQELNAHIEQNKNIFLFGSPAEWKILPNLVTRTPGKLIFLGLENPLIHSDVTGLIRCMFKEQKILPPTFGGMSGGPVFDENKKLIGLIKGEIRKNGSENQDGYIYLTSQKFIREMLTPFNPPNIPVDFMHQKGYMIKNVVYKNRLYTPIPIPIKINFEFFWSLNTPMHENGNFGRINNIIVGNNDQARYIVNVESIFPLPIICENENETDKDRKDALNQELYYMLQSMGYMII